MRSEMMQNSSSPPGERLVVLMTCHNRVASTVQCIQAIKAQVSLAASMDVLLVDDGSTDGTAAAVSAIMPEARILPGNGDLFWCGGMHLAFGEAIKADYDFYLWLNDDTCLERDAVARLLQAYQSASVRYGRASIIVGSVRDPDTGQFTYGGWRWKPGRMGLNSWQQVPPDMGGAMACATMNGNCVLIPRAVVTRVGNLDPVFRQGIGDIDYGLRAVKAGCQVVIAPGYYGVCKNNDGTGSWADETQPLLSRWRKLLGPKGFPVRAWWTFTARHKGHLWFFAWLAPYVLFWLRGLVSMGRGGK